MQGKSGRRPPAAPSGAGPVSGRTRVPLSVCVLLLLLLLLGRQFCSCHPGDQPSPGVSTHTPAGPGYICTHMDLHVCKAYIARSKSSCRDGVRSGPDCTRARMHGFSSRTQCDEDTWGTIASDLAPPDTPSAPELPGSAWQLPGCVRIFQARCQNGVTRRRTCQVVAELYCKCTLTIYRRPPDPVGQAS
jgi:hypothetical protein